MLSSFVEKLSQNQFEFWSVNNDELQEQLTQSKSKLELTHVATTTIFMRLRKKEIRLCVIVDENSTIQEYWIHIEDVVMWVMRQI